MVVFREGEFSVDQDAHRGEAEPVDDNDARQPEFLAGVSMDPTGKRPAPCFAFAKDGKCPFPNCKYSHNSEDIRRYQEFCQTFFRSEGNFSRSEAKLHVHSPRSGDCDA